MNTLPLVSVIVPVYNGDKYLKESIQSILRSDYKTLELLVIDDGSQDQSREILSNISDPRLRVFINEKNLGVAASLNRLIDASKGEFIARMDADDFCLPHRFTKQVNCMQKHREIGILGGQVKRFPGEAKFPKMPLRHEDIAAWSLFASPMIHPTVMWRKSLELRYTENPPTAEDYDLWVRAMGCTKLMNLSDSLIQYRQDFQVKKNTYLQEQKRGGKDIRSRVLKVFGYTGDCDGMMVHEKLSNLWSLDLDVSSTEVAQWLDQLRDLNRHRHVFDEEALERILSRKWYDFHIYKVLNGEACMKSFFAEKALLQQVPLLKKAKLWVKETSLKKGEKS